MLIPSLKAFKVIHILGPNITILHPTSWWPADKRIEQPSELTRKFNNSVRGVNKVDHQTTLTEKRFRLSQLWIVVRASKLQRNPCDPYSDNRDTHKVIGSNFELICAAFNIYSLQWSRSGQIGRQLVDNHPIWPKSTVEVPIIVPTL